MSLINKTTNQPTLTEKKQKKRDFKKRVAMIFSSYAWSSLFIILIAVYLDVQFSKKHILLKVIIDSFEAIGIAGLVAYIFTYVSGTSEFTSKIKELLQDVVLSRNFLGNIDTESKKEALRAIIKPSSDQKKIYSNIEDYYNTYIANTLSISSKCVRSNYILYCRTYWDSEKKVIAVEQTVTYRLYPTADGYSNIDLGFSDYSEEAPPSCSYFHVSTPEGKRITTDQPFELKKLEEDGIHKLMGSMDLTSIDKECPHLDVEFRFTEFAQDHWAIAAFSTLQPTDGFKFHLLCQNGLKIRSTNTFSYGSKLHIDHHDEGKEIAISCNQWLSEGSGISILVAKEPTADQKSPANSIVAD